ncbi:MAG: carbohydrate-binding protein, partial [Fibrobacter sp.]|nr:carbohydrate-binding protein [Fibrobacter sp.]
KVLNDASALKNWDILGAHFYASEASTADNFFQYSLADQKNVERWMTEHYTESQGSGNYWRVVMNTGDQANQNKRDTVRAMDVAYEIHRGLVLGNFSQYTWWYIRRCYGLIMEKDFSNKLSIPQNEIGKISKRGYLLSQYARFVRPGFVRIGATAKPEDQIFVSAFKNADSLVVVIVNRDISKKNHSLDFNIPGLAASTIFTPYTTTESKNVAKGTDITATNGKFNISISEEGVTTLVAASAFGPPVPREPYSGEPIAIPGKIEAENYDKPGSADRSYNDTDSENRGGEYREDGVDIYKSGTGYSVGYSQAGEWTKYTVNATEDGEFDLIAAVAGDNGTGSIQLYLDDEPFGKEIVAPKGNDYTTYTEVSGGKVKLTKGKHEIKMEIKNDWIDIDYISIQKESTEAIPLASVQLKNTLSEAQVFDLNGKLVGKIQLMNASDAVAGIKNAGMQAGIYMVQMSGKKAFLVNTAK